MKSKDMNSIGTLYGDMLNSLKKTLVKEGKKQPDNAFNSKLPIEKSQPIDGYNKALNDPESDECCDEEDNEETSNQEDYKYDKSSKYDKGNKKLRDKLKNPNISPEAKKKIETELEERERSITEETSQEMKKNQTQTINRIMKQSTFDKLYKKVLKENFGQDDNTELDALGLDDATPDSDLDDTDEFGDDEFGGEEDGDTVTVTLDRATAQALVDVLQGVLGGEEDLGDDDLDFGDEGDDEFGGDEFGDEGDDLEFGEEDNEEWGTKPAPDKKGVFQQKNNKVGGKANPKGSKKASSDVTDEQGTKQGAPSFTHLQGKDNKVKSVIKVGDFFK